MKSVFTSTIYEIATVILLVGHLFWNLSMIIHLGNILAVIPAVIQFCVFYFIYTHHRLLADGIKVWAGYLLLIGLVSFSSKVLLGLSRDQYPEGIEWKASIILTGIILWWIASRKIDLIQTEVQDNF